MVSQSTGLRAAVAELRGCHTVAAAADVLTCLDSESGVVKKVDYKVQDNGLHIQRI